MTKHIPGSLIGKSYSIFGVRPVAAITYTRLAVLYRVKAALNMRHAIHTLSQQDGSPNFDATLSRKAPLPLSGQL